MLSAAAGALGFFLLQLQVSLLAVLGSIGLLFAIMFTPHTPENVTKRLGFLCAFGACTGVSLGPLLGAVADIQPSIIPTAFLGSCAIFGSLSLAALYAERRSMLFLGGFLISGLNMLVMMLFFNIFLGSHMVFQLDVYGGLILFCGFVLFDTQLIVERFNNGDNDYVRHSLDLFLDFINIFRRLLVILASKEKKRKN
ncbi:Probable Bax inhibitor 1 [Geodia barretti]|uniref:Probable Bax inhibitor 1 n=1 Tax=Geodia barretti TaxID=519541 RepID=A0AA35X1Q3_GEOBA|nr:Probable Bax inhibitor 1 [Geodia barretti]